MRAAVLRAASLRAGQQGIGHRVEQLLGSAVAEVQNALAADAVVDRETNAYQGDVELARGAVALATAD
jgi:hypothetical protein